MLLFIGANIKITAYGSRFTQKSLLVSKNKNLLLYGFASYARSKHTCQSTKYPL